MKLFKLTLFACITGIYCEAQTNDSTGGKEYRNIVENILRQQTPQKALKTTASAERLIRSYDVITTTTTVASNDSFIFKYSGGRGSTFDYNEVTYKPLVDIQNDFLNQPDYRLPEVAADSVWHYRLNPGPGTFFLKTVQENTFNNMAFMGGCTQYLVSQPANNVRIEYSYNQQALVNELKIYNWDAANNQWKPSGMRKIKYNTHSKVSSDSAFAANSSNGYDPGSAYRYEYDNNGNLTRAMSAVITSGNTWVDLREYLFTYYPSNQLKTSAYNSNLNPPGWTLVLRDSFGYQAGIDFYTSWYQGVNFFDQGHFKFLNSQNLPDSISYVGIQNGVPTELKKRIITYNSNHNPVLSVLYTAPALVNRATHYEYETYDPLNIHKTQKDVGVNVSVYPNPAKDFINISFDTNMMDKPVSLVIYNATGLVVLSEYLIINQINGRFDIHSLPSGSYSLVVSGNNNFLPQTIQIMKY